MTATVVYQGDLRTVATHVQSASEIETDAPVDNNGKGERFSPTDLVAAALASCMLTIMGIASRTHGLNIDGTRCEVEKVMASNPRRIAEIKIALYFNSVHSFTDKDRKILENAALTCPVFLSLHADLTKTITFHW
ncbi:MAG: OsmC family peroxiredoxin [Sphingobacteriales bacterium]|nr:MAG: OsmC family peroxiredoxin [Sphingobacteriales bacterium]